MDSSADGGRKIKEIDVVRLQDAAVGRQRQFACERHSRRVRRRESRSAEDNLRFAVEDAATRDGAQVSPARGILHEPAFDSHAVVCCLRRGRLVYAEEAIGQDNRCGCSGLCVHDDQRDNHVKTG